MSTCITPGHLHCLGVSSRHGKVVPVFWDPATQFDAAPGVQVKAQQTQCLVQWASVLRDQYHSGGFSPITKLA